MHHININKSGFPGPSAALNIYKTASYSCPGPPGQSGRLKSSGISEAKLAQNTKPSRVAGTVAALILITV